MTHTDCEYFVFVIIKFRLSSSIKLQNEMVASFLPNVNECNIHASIDLDNVMKSDVWIGDVFGVFVNNEKSQLLWACVCVCVVIIDGE